MDSRERRLFIPFLLKVLTTLAGSEGSLVRELYHRLSLATGLERRLCAPRPKLRALAALEVGSFQVDPYFPQLLTLLRDPAPHVAHTAAKGLAATQRLEFAGPVLDWVLKQETIQQERLLWILESFGSSFLPWLETRLEGQSPGDYREWMLYALLAASTRQVQEPDPLIAMLAVPDIELQAASLKALGALGMPQALSAVMAFADHPAWVLRAQAAKAIGVLAGPGAVPRLLELICDPVFDVRRNAAQALWKLGSAGVEALRWIALDASADPFARDLALERLQWEGARRHP
jgi:HEAT repeat protein